MTLGPVAADIRRELAEMKMALLEAVDLFAKYRVMKIEDYDAADLVRLIDLRKLAEGEGG